MCIMLQVQGYSNLYRDEETSAIVNKSQDYQKYLEAKKLRMQIPEQVKELKEEVQELKSLIGTLLEKLNEK